MPYSKTVVLKKTYFQKVLNNQAYPRQKNFNACPETDRKSAIRPYVQ